MSLPTGTYYIHSADDKYVIGRNIVEDLSLLPKRVVTLSKVEHGHPTWDVMVCDDGSYKIKTGGSYVGVLPDGHGRVSAFLLEDMIQGAEWTFIAVPQAGADVYIIRSANGDQQAWTYADERHAQLTVKPLVSTLSDPPQYGSNQLFKITSA